MLRHVSLAWLLALAGTLAPGCKSEESPPTPAPVTRPEPTPPAPAPAATPADAAPSVDATVAVAPSGPDPRGEFDAQGQLLFRLAACGGTAELPARLPVKGIDAHCAALDKVLAEYKEKWLDRAAPFFATIVPTDLPRKVLYPFGGSDLITALAVFPDAEEITIISLEQSGDIRVVEKLKNDELLDSLRTNREHLTFLLRSAFHRTEDLKELTATGIPSELFDDMVALRVHGREPVTVRYFTLAADGTPTYVDSGKNLKNVEITFRRPGGPISTYRHISADLSNGGLKKNDGLKAYFKARAPFTAMTKASSFLLWKDYFSTIRNMLLDDMVFLISDATAPLPSDVKKHGGLEQIPYGHFAGPEVAFEGLDGTEMIELWAKSEPKPCPVRFGYSDSNRRAHLLITRKTSAK
jgi:hypothetical protein